MEGSIYRIVRRDGDSALILVTDVDPTTQSVSVSLLSPDIEFGTSADLVLKKKKTGLAYDLLAESDIFGYAWVTQLDRLLGRVDSGIVQSLAALRNDDAVGHPVAGPPVVRRTDPRWNFKLHELKRLQTLTADYTHVLIDSTPIDSP